MKFKQNVVNSIIFDFGGVILPIDFQRTVDAFRKLGLDLSDDFSFLKQNSIFDGWDRGQVSKEEMVHFFRSQIPATSESPLRDTAIIAAWNQILGGIPLQRLELLEELSKKIPIYLLSNTNILHIECLRLNDPLMSRFEKSFAKIYYSYEIGKRKPDAECFMSVVQEQGLDISRTLFIDDHPKNIEAAQALGFQTLHCLSEITELLKLTD